MSRLVLSARLTSALWVRLVYAIGLLTCVSSPLSAKDLAISVYGGWLTSNDWEEIFVPGELDLVDSYLATLAVSRTIARPTESIELELEGQVVRHFGIQDHWAFNGLGVIRWTSFPWDELLDMSVAGGLGVSYATEQPKAEIEFEGETERLLAYWMVELDAALPNTQDWHILARLHHRSPAYGLFGDGGGANVLALGLRYRF